jgi:uncharacterized membrane protein YqjE
VKRLEAPDSTPVQKAKSKTEIRETQKFNRESQAATRSAISIVRLSLLVAIAAYIFDAMWLVKLGSGVAVFFTLDAWQEYRIARACIKELEAAGQPPNTKIYLRVIGYSQNAVRSGVRVTEILLLIAILAFVFDATELSELSAVTAVIYVLDALFEYWCLCWCERQNGSSGKPPKPLRFYFETLWLVRLGRFVTRFARRNRRRSLKRPKQSKKRGDGDGDRA